MTALAMPPGWDIQEVNRWLHYHGEITREMTNERTALESKLIPVTAYILISAVECYRRHPEMVKAIDEATSAEQIGEKGRRPGNQIDSVHIWSQANIFLLGRNILMMLGRITPSDDPERTAVVLDFWKRVAPAFRGDGHMQAYDAGLVCTPYTREVIDELLGGTAPVGESWSSVKRLNATLTSYLFLLYFDTRSGMVDTGPYDLGGRRVMLVRDFSKMGPSDFWWSKETAASLPYSNLTAAFVLKDTAVRVNDWGTSITDPRSYLDQVERFGLFTTDSGRLEPVTLDACDEIREATRGAQRRLYRLISDMSRRERIDAGAYVYFSFLRPFAEVAGVAEDLEWAVPKESLDVYESLEPFEGTPTTASASQALPYYPPFP